MSVLAILQARMSSSRMPGKVMAQILGQPMIARQIERLSRCHTLDRIVVATSVDASDDPLVAFLVSQDVAVHRGSLSDVLGRFAGCASAHPSSHIVRLTADCPLTDPQVIDAAVRLALSTGAAYCSNAGRRTFPDGLDVEVLTANALHIASALAADPQEREHVTPFVRERPDQFRAVDLVQTRDLSHLRWTVDRREDFLFVRTVFAHLYPDKPDFGTDDILHLLDAEPRIAHLAEGALRAAA